jgi:hypothetical protein
MMDMVRKHCVEGSGNYITAQACVDRTHEMLRMFKKATETFVHGTPFSFSGSTTNGAYIGTS